MIGEFVINFFVSVSMKEIIKAIVILQIISFFVLINIDYSPFSMLFLKSIYQFTTFKLIPPEFMDKILIFLGIKEQEKVGGKTENTLKRMLTGTQDDHEEPKDEHDDVEISNMTEAGYTHQSGIVKNLNFMIIGFLILLIAIVFVAVGRLIMRTVSKKRMKKIKKITSTVKTQIFHGVHTAVNTSSVPIQVTAFHDLKLCLEEHKSLTKFISPLCIIGFFVAYPIATYAYLSPRKERLEDLDEKFLRRKHRAVFAALRYYRKDRLGLGYIFFLHYRRLIYSLVIVALSSYPSIQIMIVMFISTIMMITVMNSLPYQTHLTNIQECANEVMILILTYHMIFFTDHVQDYH